MTGSEQQLLWMDRAGHVLERIDQAAGAIRLRLSPNGGRLAMLLRGDVWILELARGVLSRILLEVVPIQRGRPMGNASSSTGERVAMGDGGQLIQHLDADHSAVFEQRFGRGGPGVVLPEPCISLRPVRPPASRIREQIAGQ